MRHDVRQLNSLASYKAEARNRINDAAGRARTRNTTTVVGQMDTYRMKYIEAIDFRAAGYPNDPPNWPWMKAEVLGTNKSRVQACDDIIAAQEAWQVIAADIERYRLQGQRLIQAATDIKQVLQVGKAAVNILNSK